MGDVTYIRQPSGAAFLGCPCMAASWPTITQLAVARGLIRQQFDVSQGAYNSTVDASALTHARGGVADIWQTDQAVDDLLEECGIASYVRTAADGFKPHSHILWIGCPHLHPQAAAQVTDWRNLRNGLKSHAPDRDRTRPTPIRTWQEGLAWAKAQLGDDMPLTDSDVSRVARAVWAATFGAHDDTAGARLARTVIAAEAAAANTRPITRGGTDIPLRQEVADIKTVLLAGAGVDVDEELLAQVIVGALTPALRAAIVEAVEAGGTPAAVADVVLARLGTAITAGVTP